MNRDHSIDVAKGLVIGSVVLGHILEALVLAGEGGHAAGASYRSIYLFHMPFWFLLSGWLFKEAQPPGGYFRKKFLHLMVPYFAWLLVFNLKAIAGFGVNLARGDLAGDKLQFYLDHFGAQLYGGLAVHGTQMILWFPPCLFFTQQLANWILGRFRGTGARVAWGVGALSAAYAQQYLFPSFHLPLALDVVAGALPFFLLGHGLHGLPGPSKLTAGAGACFLLAVAAIWLWDVPLAYHMRMAEYGLPLLSTVAALGGFLLTLALARPLAAASPPLARALCWIGAASMTIMYLHAVVLAQLRAWDCHAPWWLLLGGVLVPAALHHTLARAPFLSPLFLGTPRRMKLGGS